MKLVVSYAHDVREDLPVRSGKFVCLKCGLRGDIKGMFGDKKCKPTLYKDNSGWKDEATPEQRKELDRRVRENLKY
ncbi:MAG: hypothetical protein MUF12_01985 [Sediminibacterium sp.]|jgi:hypothetical protein|nr:hypothetical protein [Sediminibacterium sp.]